MASIKPHKDRYRVSICVNGTRETKVLRTLREAKAWASAREFALRDSRPAGERFTVQQVLQKYLDEEVPKKRGKRAETARVTRLLGSDDLPLTKPLADLSEADIALFRDARMRVVKPATVLREIALLSNLFELARVEWKMIGKNPVTDVRKPPKPHHRERVITWSEIRAMLKSLGYSRHGVQNMTQATAYVFLIALRTGMRCGEVCSLQWSQVRTGYVTGVGDKTIEHMPLRDVPLSRHAQATIERLRSWDTTMVVNVSAGTVDTLFRRHRNKLGLSGFTFHDSRHTAATWIAQKIHILDLCKMFGWKSTTRALTYYNPSPESIAAKL